MLRKTLSITALMAVLVTSVSCGGTTTSMYKSRETLGSQISNNINKIVNDTEKNMPTTYGTYNQANRVYTNSNRGYANNYTRLNTNYNGVVINDNMVDIPRTTVTTTDFALNNTARNKMQNNLNNLNNTTVRKSNTMTNIKVNNKDNNTVVRNNVVRKANTMTNVPVENSTMYNSNMINKVLNSTNDTVDSTLNMTPVGSVADTNVSPMIIA